MKNVIQLIGLILVLLSGIQNAYTQDIQQFQYESKRLNSMTMSLLAGSKKVGVGLKYKSLYGMNPTFRVGWGIGFDTYSIEFERNFVPISFELMGDLFQEDKTPFFGVGLGYGIALKETDGFAEKARGGLMLDFSVGYKSKNLSSQPFLAVGYRFQSAYYEGSDGFGNENKSVSYNRWVFTSGIFF